MSVRGSLTSAVSRLRARLGGEDGFTVMIALGVLVVTSLLAAGAYAAVQADTPLAQRDLDGKRAYYAARAGVNAFLYQLNQNPSYWQTCFPEGATRTAVAPGTTSYYTYEPVLANGKTTCSPSPPATGDPITSLIDEDSGTFRVRFTGYAGCPTSADCPRQEKAGIIASFRKDTPLDYLWFTIFETLDPKTYPADGYNYAANCAKLARPPDPRPNECTDINWISGDQLKGPAYTWDQYLINGTPSFGRANSNDKIESVVDSTDPDDICAGGDCTGANFLGEPTPKARIIAPPPDNSLLLTDAQKYGMVVSGTTTIQLNGASMSVTSCPTPATCTTVNPQIGKFSATPKKTPLIYVQDSGTSCAQHPYSPYQVTYSSSGACGDVYVKGSYNASLTIASQGDIIVTDDILRSGGAPVPTLGLVANNFVRVQHGVTTRPNAKGNCDVDGPGGTPAASNIAAQSHSNLEIDAAILGIQHSFIVDNYDCGAKLDNLTVKGAIAQIFRGTVGTGGSSGASTGYIKDYNYDDRFAVALPPYLFDITSSAWHVARETLCVPNGTSDATACTPPP